MVVKSNMSRGPNLISTLVSKTCDIHREALLFNISSICLGTGTNLERRKPVISQRGFDKYRPTACSSDRWEMLDNTFFSHIITDAQTDDPIPCICVQVFSIYGWFCRLHCSLSCLF